MQLLPNCEAKTVDEELWVRGSSVMAGYYKMPQETEQTLIKDGWLRTGDFGYVDKDGFVYLTGRKKNLIITKNGENVSPEEIENKIGEYCLVQEILVRVNDGVIDVYNQSAPAYKRVYRMKVRETEFEKPPSKKIKRY